MPQPAESDSSLCCPFLALILERFIHKALCLFFYNYLNLSIIYPKMTAELRPPAQPAFILRGHSAQIHALHFTHGNTRLLTADAEGWIVSWNLAFKRPVAVWKAHENAILSVGSWSSDRIITFVHNLETPYSLHRLTRKATVMAETTNSSSGSSVFKTRPPWIKCSPLTQLSPPASSRGCCMH